MFPVSLQAEFRQQRGRSDERRRDSQLAPARDAKAMSFRARSDDIHER